MDSTQPVTLNDIIQTAVVGAPLPLRKSRRFARGIATVNPRQWARKNSWLWQLMSQQASTIQSILGADSSQMALLFLPFRSAEREQSNSPQPIGYVIGKTKHGIARGCLYGENMTLWIPDRNTLVFSCQQQAILAGRNTEAHLFCLVKGLQFQSGEFASIRLKCALDVSRFGSGRLGMQAEFLRNLSLLDSLVRDRAPQYQFACVQGQSYHLAVGEPLLTQWLKQARFPLSCKQFAQVCQLLDLSSEEQAFVREQWRHREATGDKFLLCPLEQLDLLMAWLKADLRPRYHVWKWQLENNNVAVYVPRHAFVPLVELYRLCEQTIERGSIQQLVALVLHACQPLVGNDGEWYDVWQRAHSFHRRVAPAIRELRLQSD